MCWCHLLIWENLGRIRFFEELVKKTSVSVRLGLRYQLDVQVDLVRKQLNT